MTTKISTPKKEKATLEVAVLSAFDVTKAELKKLVDDYKGLVVTEETFENAKKARAVIREKRFAIQKQQDANDKKRIAWNREQMNDNKKNAEELLAIIQPTEDKIDAQIKEIEAKKEEIRMEKERAKQAVIQARIERITATGATRQPEGWKLDDQYVGDEEVQVMPEKFFDIVVQNFQLKAEQIAAEKEAEENRIAEEKAEKERLKKEAEAKLEADQLEVEKQKKELAEKQAAFDAEQNKRAEEQKAEAAKLDNERMELHNQKIKLRKTALFALGMAVGSEGFSFNNILVETDTITRTSDADWDKLLERTATIIKNEKQRFIEEEKIKSEMQVLQKNRAEALLPYMKNAHMYTDLWQLTDEQFEKQLSDARTGHEEMEKSNAAKKRALLPDKEKLQIFLEDLKKITRPEVKTDEAQGIMEIAMENIGDAIRFITTSLESL